MNYYDDYTLNTGGMAFAPFGGLAQQPARGLATGGRARLLTPAGEGAMLTSVTYYDAKNRPVQTDQQTPFGAGSPGSPGSPGYGATRTDLELDFTGQVLRQTVAHANTDGKPSHTVVTEYAYDHMGRKTQTGHAIQTAGQPAPQGLTLAEYGYDETGRLLQKRIQPGTYRTIESSRDTARITRNAPLTADATDVAGTITLKAGFSIGGGVTYIAQPKGVEYGTTPALQVMDYAYNVRGWMTAINGGVLDKAQNDLFGLRLGYQEAGAAAGGLFNGNIHTQGWLSHNVRDFPVRRYTYPIRGGKPHHGGGLCGRQTRGRELRPFGHGLRQERQHPLTHAQRHECGNARRPHRFRHH